MKPESAAATYVPHDRWERMAAPLREARSLSERRARRVTCASTVPIATLRRRDPSAAGGAGGGGGPVERVMAALGAPAGGGRRREAPPWAVSSDRIDLLREIGHGGMGVVYLARRADGVYQRRSRSSWRARPCFDATLRDRFLAERDILAGLAHPNIATLFDGGVTDEGCRTSRWSTSRASRSTRYCDAGHLDLRARIRLFLRTLRGGRRSASRARRASRPQADQRAGDRSDGDVKLLDFGIAKLLGPEDEPIAGRHRHRFADA